MFAEHHAKLQRKTKPYDTILPLLLSQLQIQLYLTDSSHHVKVNQTRAKRKNHKITAETRKEMLSKTENQKAKLKRHDKAISRNLQAERDRHECIIKAESKKSHT